LPWEIELEDDVVDWFLKLAVSDPISAALVQAAIDKLEEQGPGCGRPLVDSIKGSRHSNLKELRPGSSGSSEMRILFAFDKRRTGLLLVAGDKSGQWNKWYKVNIPIADDLFDAHQARLEEE
jgi:hypothetical protein